MATTCVSTTLKKNNGVSDQNKVLQHALGIKEDGNFGPVTETAVMAYQRKKGLAIDGVAGEITCKSLGIWCKQPASNKGPIQKAFEKVLGSFDSATTAYNLTKAKGHYSKYFNNQKNLKQEILDLLNNCVDWAEAFHALLKEMKYDVRFIGIYCPVDKINHAYIEAKGKEFSNWTALDLAAATESGYSIGRHWCSGAKTINPNWCPSEDGQAV